MIEWMLFALTGVFAGFSAGLLGLGGGVIIVPVLVFIFTSQNVSADQVMHVAIGTSLMTITVTSLSATWAHHRKGTVDWHIFRQLLVGLILGGMIGALTASHLSSDLLQRIFAIYVLFIAVKMWFKSTQDRVYNPPDWKGSFLVGTGIGSTAAILGIGGGSLTVPYLLAINKTMHKAVGTAAACGFPIAVSGVVGFILTGQNTQFAAADWYSGFINWQAFLGIIATSILVAPVGAALAKRLPVKLLKQIFSLFLIVIGWYMW